MSRHLLLVTAGGLAREVAEAARAGGDHVVGHLDDDPSTWGDVRTGATVLGGLDLVERYPGCAVTVCAGRGAVRRALVGRLLAAGTDPDRFAAVVHPSVHVPASCTVGRGTVVLAGSVLTADVRLGEHVVLMPHVTLTHDDVVADGATLCAGVALGGGVHVGQDAYLGMRAVVREGVRIGAGTIVGAGAIVLTDVPEGQVWYGVPARPAPARPAPVLTPTPTPTPVPARPPTHAALPVADDPPAQRTHATHSNGVPA